MDKDLLLLWPALTAACTRAHSHEVWPWLAWPLAGNADRRVKA